MSADEHEGYIFGEAPSIAAATKDRQAALDAHHAGANVAEIVGGRVRRFVCDCCEPAARRPRRRPRRVQPVLRDLRRALTGKEKKA